MTNTSEFSRQPFWPFAASVLFLTALVYCSKYVAPAHTPQPLSVQARHRVVAWQHGEDFHQPLAQFETVFWEPRDTESLRQRIRETDLVRGKSVLEIGTGTGLVALCCLQAGAEKVVATDVNPAAIANARWNAESRGLSDRLDARLVPLERPAAYTVIEPTEQFDLIISNPPWEDQTPNRIDEFALYDTEFKLLTSIVRDAAAHLKPGGRILLAYGSRDAILRIPALAQQYRYQFVVHDDRSLDELPGVFLPGMLIELKR